MDKGPRPPPESIIIKSRIREYIKSKGFNTSGEILDGDTLNDAIIEILDKAIARAKANNRKTVTNRDL